MIERRIEKVSETGAVIESYDSARLAIIDTGDFAIVDYLEGRAKPRDGIRWRYAGETALESEAAPVKKCFSRLAHVALITNTSPQLGLRSAVRNLADEVREFSWHPYWTARQLPQMRADFAKMVDEFTPDAIFMQIQTPGVVTASMLENSTAFKMQWNGDLRDTLPEHSIDLAKLCDLSMFSNMRDVLSLRELGHRAEYLNIGISPTVFCPKGPKRPDTPEIVFLGNNYPNRFPRSSHRMKMVSMLREKYGSRFAVHGSGWSVTDPWLCEEEEAAAYRSCKIAISNEHYFVDRFSSDRILRATGSGAFVLSSNYPGIDRDFIPGKEVEVWNDLDELCFKIDYFLSADDERNAIAAAGCRRTHASHTWANRIAQLQEIIEKEAVKA